MKKDLIELEDLKEIVHSIRDFRDVIQREEEENSVTQEKTEQVTEYLALQFPDGMESRSKALCAEAERGARILAQQKVIRTLMFPDMKQRLSNVVQAHKGTYDWAYGPDIDVTKDPEGNKDCEKSYRTPITHWLDSQDGVFWVARKAGSGKSTFMKRLCLDTGMKDLLGKWAGQKRLVMANFFFWNAGSRLQKSQEGLLRTLLFEVLRACPYLIPVLFPGRWQDAVSGAEIDDEWTRNELNESLRKVLEQEITDTAFCFFIDGLDEYLGDPIDLVQLLNPFVKESSVKICLSSRPWNSFEEALGQDKSRYLRLEEHNHKDIVQYVNDTIAKSHSFAQLQREDPECGNLISEIVEKSQGVFLWVFLVVRSLVRGLSNCDTVRNLQSRLRGMPQELEPYFSHMIDSIEDVYRHEMAEFLQIAVLAVESYPLTIYSLLLESDNEAWIQARIDSYNGPEYSTSYLVRTQNRSTLVVRTCCKCTTQRGICVTTAQLISSIGR